MYVELRLRLTLQKCECEGIHARQMAPVVRIAPLLAPAGFALLLHLNWLSYILPPR